MERGRGERAVLMGTETEREGGGCSLVYQGSLLRIEIIGALGGERLDLLPLLLDKAEALQAGGGQNRALTCTKWRNFPLLTERGGAKRFGQGLRGCMQQVSSYAAPRGPPPRGRLPAAGEFLSFPYG